MLPKTRFCLGSQVFLDPGGHVCARRARTSAHACGPHGLQTSDLARDTCVCRYTVRYVQTQRCLPALDPKTPGSETESDLAAYGQGVELVHPSTAPANNRRVIYRARPENGPDHTDPWHAHDPTPPTHPRPPPTVWQGWDGGRGKGGGGGAGGAGRTPPGVSSGPFFGRAWDRPRRA